MHQFMGCGGWAGREKERLEKKSGLMERVVWLEEDEDESSR